MVIREERTVFSYEHLSYRFTLDLFLQVVIPAGARETGVEPESMCHSTCPLDCRSR